MHLQILLANRGEQLSPEITDDTRVVSLALTNIAKRVQSTQLLCDEDEVTDMEEPHCHEEEERYHIEDKEECIESQWAETKRQSTVQ